MYNNTVKILLPVNVLKRNDFRSRTVKIVMAITDLQKINLYVCANLLRFIKKSSTANNIPINKKISYSCIA